LTPITSALGAGLLPVIYGDVVFDLARGGTIFSTEDLFTHLAAELGPRKLLLAGLEPGVWADYPACTKLVETITPLNYPEIAPALGGSSAIDVTGGMASKVELALRWVEVAEDLEVQIFSGEDQGAVHRALTGSKLGTRICNSRGVRALTF
jgi:isopentenyl phosphate kinase